jgi:hypothetical protein
MAESAADKALRLKVEATKAQELANATASPQVKIPLAATDPTSASAQPAAEKKANEAKDFADRMAAAKSGRQYVGDPQNITGKDVGLHITGNPETLPNPKPSGPKSVGDPVHIPGNPANPEPEMSPGQTQVAPDGRRVTGNPVLAKGSKIVKPD